MKIFSAAQIREWDEYTISHEPISSVNLMERAANRCCEWLMQTVSAGKRYMIFCGPGNNGGDGLAIARLLIQQEQQVEVYILGGKTKPSADFNINLRRLQAVHPSVITLERKDSFPVITDADIIIDALFGYGLNRPLEGLAPGLVEYINASGASTISIDMPSGLMADKTSIPGIIVQADITLTFQCLKLAFLLPENALYTGDIKLLDIGLDKAYYEHTSTTFEITEAELIRSFLEPRKKFSHKGSYGNAAFIAGSHGMMGAAVLGAKACLRIGAGKLTCYIPGCGYSVLQTAVPEAMCITDANDTHHTVLDFKTRYDAYAIGPGMGQYKEGLAAIEALLAIQPERLVVDADALNILSIYQELYAKLPPHTILTPHPKEFERLFGESQNNFQRLYLALEKARELQVYIILKGNYSFIATPSGKGYFNPTGNPGMATAGSGDVLTGILAGLYAQNSHPEQVALLGVYLHGLAGDIAAEQKTEQAMIAGDIVDCIPFALAAVKPRFIFSK